MEFPYKSKKIKESKNIKTNFYFVLSWYEAIKE